MNTFPPNSKVQKIVINTCYGGWGLSDAGLLEYAKRKGMRLYPKEHTFGVYMYTVPLDKLDVEKHQIFWHSDIGRDDPILVAMVEESPGKWDGEYSDLRVVEIPEGVTYEIDDYDGIETIHESHRSWS